MMPGKDKVDLRQCIELLTEMLENEGRGMNLFLKFNVKIFNIHLNLNYVQEKFNLHIFQCDHFKSASLCTIII